MKKLIVILSLMLISPAAWAQFTISGRITDSETGEPLIGTSVVLEGTSKGSVADVDGKYSVTVQEKGSYTLVYSFIGYETIKKSFEVSGNVSQDIAMAAKATSLDGLNIYGKKLYPVTKTTIDKEELQKVNLGQDLPILLNFTPSIVTTSDAGAGVGYTGFRIRGSDPQRINVTVNGIPLNDSESHGVFWVNMPDFATSVENIAIQRGVGTSTNGAAAFGATVNLTTQQPTDEAFAAYNGSYGSFNTVKNNVQFGTGLINDKLSFTGRLSKITSDGFIDNAFVDLKSFFISGNYKSKLGDFTANVFSGQEQTFQAWNGVPEDSIRAGNRTYNELAGYDNETDNYQQDHYQLLFNRKLNANWKLNAALHYTRGRGYFEQFKSGRGFADYGLSDPNVIDQTTGDTIKTTDVIVRRWLDNHFYGAIASANYTKGKLDFIVGGGWNRYEGGHFGEVIWAEYTPQDDIRDRYYENDATKTDFNTYAKATYELANGLYGFLDLQYRRINYEFVGNFIRNDTEVVSLPQEETLNFFNPKFGFKYLLKNGEIYASYAIANKEPNRDDFVDNTQNSRPEHETLRNLEVGYMGRVNDELEIGANIYWMDYDNQLILTGQINDVGAATRRNVAESYRLGIELQAAWRPDPVFTWQANATFSQNKINNFSEFLDTYGVDTVYQSELTYSETDIAFSPSVIAANEFIINLESGLQLALQTKYVGEQFLDNSSSDERKLDAFTTTNFRISYNFKTKGFKNIGLNLMVNNILDEAYEPNGYTYGWLTENGGQLERTSVNYYYPQAGINFLVGLNIRM